MTPQKVDVLLATGKVTVEHDNEFRSFRHHSSMLTTLLESTGRFRVRVLEEVRGIGDELLDHFDVVLIMYEGRDDYHSKAERLGDTTEQALLRFVRDKGCGVVWFHGSSVQEPDWGGPVTSTRCAVRPSTGTLGSDHARRGRSSYEQLNPVIRSPRTWRPSGLSSTMTS